MTNMKLLTALVVAALGLAPRAARADPIEAFELIAPGPASSNDIVLRLENHNPLTILSATFDLSGTEADAPGNQPLVIGPPTFSEVNGTSGSATFASATATSWTYQFSKFLSGEFFQFNWDPDIAADSSYGAVVAEQRGLRVSIGTTAGMFSGVLAPSGSDGGLRAVIAAQTPTPSPTPEPASLLLCGAGVAAAIARARRRQPR